MKTMRLVTFPDGTDLPYILDRKRVKNINLRIRDDASVYVSAPLSAAQADIDNFLRREQAFIEKHVTTISKRLHAKQDVASFADGSTLYLSGKPVTLHVSSSGSGSIWRVKKDVYMTDPEDDPGLRRKLYRKWLRVEAPRLMNASIKRVYPLIEPYGVPMPQFRQRFMKSRWGSCMPFKRIITLNTQLAVMEPGSMDEIVAHELCHLIYPNHSAAFYELLTDIMPDWKQKKDAMNKFTAYCL